MLMLSMDTHKITMGVGVHVCHELVYMQMNVYAYMWVLCTCHLVIGYT
jgi:hypothetical protein